jgi:hypothetical protein
MGRAEAMMGDAKRSNEREIKQRWGLRLGMWLVLALWVLPQPTWAAFNSTVASTISWFYAVAFSRTPVPNSTLPDYGDLGGPDVSVNRALIAGRGGGACGACRGRAADLALRLARYFAGSAEFRLGLQKDYELRLARQEILPRIAREIQPRV